MTPMDKKIRWGILGTGKIANYFASDFDFVKHGKLQAVASREEAKAVEFAERYKIPRAYGSYAELYMDPEVDAIYVATPHNFHFENTSQALKHGKAVLCEKPITVNPQELEELISISKDTGQYLMEGMWTYFLPALQKAQEWVAAGRIGKVVNVRSDFGYAVPFDAEGRMYNPALAGGSLLDMGIYPIAMAWLFYKQQPASMTVLARKASTGVDHDVTMLFEYEDAAAILASAFRCKLHNHTFVIGEKGYIMIPDFWKADKLFLYEEDECVDTYTDPRKSLGFNFETDAVNLDLLQGKKESDIMPLSFSQAFQETLANVMQRF